jgi:hypothetical protein
MTEAAKLVVSRQAANLEAQITAKHSKGTAMTKKVETTHFATDSMMIKSLTPKAGTATMVAGDLLRVQGSQQPKTTPIETVGSAKPPPSKND